MVKKIFTMLIALACTMGSKAQDNMEYGRNITDFASKPKVGAYFVGKYTYSDQDGMHGGDGFYQRYLRIYADGTILKDFKYRVQVQANNSSYFVNDMYLEWNKHKEMSVRVGQFKRAFTFENPYNPWEVGTGDYSQLVKQLAGMGDYCGEGSSNGGRDKGVQVQGDLFPSTKDGHRFFHYQLAMYDGQGINMKDANGGKDFIGTLQVQPIKDLYIGVFGWKGDYADATKGITVDRNRYAFGAKYEHDGWSARAEYAHSQGHSMKAYNGDGTFSDKGKQDAWYATVGVPCNDWLKVYAKYDVFRSQADWESAKTVCSLVPNIQIHKNLMLQVQYNYVNDRSHAAKDHHYNEVWSELYVRF